ncbi:hypothetical protein IWX90DRAFT_478826 [Phyllosticta citrichinensis]|uniref:Aminoglycoside phosphotransferase domain-containing protein n=1 Tax=Phyllosticta citrichinensis TaxID=1130410 RepID=A0ABR1XRI3_9PEZI
MACTRLRPPIPLRSLPLRLISPSRNLCCPRLFLRSAFKAASSSCAENSSASRADRQSGSMLNPNQELFEYTSARWMFNQKQRLSERRNVFNVPEFKKLAAQSINQKAADVVSFKKLADGGNYRLFRITMRDGFELVGRIPYAMVVPKDLAVSSEVATMDYLRLNGLPIPKVFGYSATSKNAAGTEYIFMELVAGTCLQNLWIDDLPQKDKLDFVEKLVELESRILALEFPASGSLYYSKDLEAEVRRIDVQTPNSSKGGRFCVVPDTDLALWFGKRAELDADRGPYRDPVSVLNAGAKKEIAFLKQFGRPIFPCLRIYREFFNYQKRTPAQHLEVLKKYLQITPYLVSHDEALTMPALRQHHLSADSIMVSLNLEITGLLGWWDCSIRPLFLQCGVPDKFKDDDCLDLSIKVAEGNEVGEIDQSLLAPAIALPLSYLRRRLFGDASKPWFGDDYPLTLQLIRAQLQWHRLACTNPKNCETCLLNFTAAKDARYQEFLSKRMSASPAVDNELEEITIESEIEQNRKIYDNRCETDGNFNEIAPYLGFSEYDGMVNVENQEEAKKRLDLLKYMGLAEAADEKERALDEEHWAFQDFDEDEYIQLGLWLDDQGFEKDCEKRGRLCANAATGRLCRIDGKAPKLLQDAYSRRAGNQLHSQRPSGPIM